MKTIIEKFNYISERNPVWSSYICFCETISGRNLMPKLIKQYFNKLVDKDDYARNEKNDIIEYLCKTFGYKQKQSK